MAKIISALYPGKCVACGKRYAEGDRINYDRTAPRGKRARHLHCESALSEQSTAPNMFTTFDSPAAFADAITAFRAAGNSWHHDSASWTGETLAQSLAFARSGNDALVADAERLIESLRVDVPETTRPLYIPAPYGAYPIVPEALAGFPLSMRARRRVEDARAPLRVYADLTTSGGVDVETIAKRGTAILALAMMLSESRALDFYVLSPLNNRGGATAAIVKINAQPLELATACYALTSAGFARNMGYGWAREGHGLPEENINWAFGRFPEGGEAGRYAMKMRAALNLQPNDLFVPPVFLGDMIEKHPAQWITERMAELGALTETEAETA